MMKERPDMKIFDILRGINGHFEIGRVSLAIGGFFATTSPIGFEIYEIGWNGGHFDVAAWCLAYPGGLVALVSGWRLCHREQGKGCRRAQTTVAAIPPPKLDL
jgi:hypothetical protein